MEPCELKINTAYNACGEIAIIKDILKSEHTGTVILFVRFVRNIGDSRPYDMLTIVTGKPDFGISEWTLASPEEVGIAIDNRLDYISNTEVRSMIELADWTAYETQPEVKALLVNHIKTYLDTPEGEFPDFGEEGER